MKGEEVALSQEEWKQNPNKFKILDSDLYLWHLVKPNGLVLPHHINGSLSLSNLTSADGLVLPYDFDLNKLICPSYIKNEILQNPDKYFRKPPSEEENISIHHKR